MKAIVQPILRRLGLKLSRARASPYDYLLSVPRYRETTVKLLAKDFKIADSASFHASFQEIFLDEIYKFHSAKERPFVIDCGSNYGTSVVYFKTLYPDSRIVAVEPDPKIFELLRWNLDLRGYEDVGLLRKAVSSSPGPIRFCREGADGGRAASTEAWGDVVEVEPVALDALITEPVDFLKMDIEGSETNAICSSERLGDVDQLFVEYHSFRGSPQTLSDLLAKLRSSGFRYYINTQFCSPRPLTEERVRLGMDLQLNIFAKRPNGE